MEDAQQQQQQQQQHMELEREVGDRRRGRPILVAVDHSPKSKHAFDWAIAHLCRLADTLHLVHVLPNSPGDKINSSHESPQALFEATSALMEKLAVEAYEIAMVKTEVQIVSGEVGKAIVDEAKRINPIAVVLGRHGHGILKSVLQGSVSEYCSHHCPCPVVLVPPKKQGDQSVL